MVLMVDEIEWAPRPGHRQGGRPSLWADRLAPFIEQPGKGGYLPDHWPHGVLSDLRRAQAKGLLPGRWEFATTSKGAPPNRRRLWACYLGED